ncbi:hypothetical protein GOV11_02260 [Candidatus Woesearchaeota archaeon]|nr:hypothetical protein [Candidatus Woesearchaeota archaeon]
MKPIQSMFNEVQYELVKIILLNVFLTTVILFLALDLVALIFNMPLWYVIVISFIYFTILMASEVRKISIKNVEDKNPELREILRTAKDNQNEETLMAHALFYDVMQKMRRVSSGTFLDFKKLMTKISIIFVLSVVLVSITFMGVNIAKFDNPFAGPLGTFGSWFRDITGQADGTAGTEGPDDVFGDYQMAQLGENDLVATINPSLSNPDFNDVDPASPSNDPLRDLTGGDDTGFNTGGSGFSQEGIDERDLERSYRFAISTQE